jgi:hypothetical protein
MNRASPCSHCKENGHSASKCPSLHDVLKEGFYSGGGGGGGHSHDDDDERATNIQKTPPPPSILPTGRSL